MNIHEYIREKKKWKDFTWFDDLERIIRVMQEHNIVMSYQEAFDIWSDYSNDSCATWIALDEEDEILFNRIINFLEE